MSLIIEGTSVSVQVSIKIYSRICRFFTQFEIRERIFAFHSGGLPSTRMEHFYGVLVQSVHTEPWNRPVIPDKSHGSYYLEVPVEFNCYHSYHSLALTTTIVNDQNKKHVLATREKGTKTSKQTKG